MTQSVSAKGFLGHPRGLAVCFLTEMWERFSFYGMKALLTLYLTKHFLFTDALSFQIYGAYTALVYIGPLFGGMIADRYLGSRKAVTLGAVLLVLGHFGMAFEGAPALQTVVDGQTAVERDPFFLQIFYLSLGLICIGVGFLKPNISTLVGDLYEPGDARRDSGFTIFYMGINLGAAIASALCGYLGETYGWQYGFGLAGIGMLMGLIVFQRGQKYLPARAEPPNPVTLKARTRVGLSTEWLIYLGSFAAVLSAWFLVQNFAVVGKLLGASGVMAAAIILYVCLFRASPEERGRMLTATTLIIFSIFFWALFEQSGSSMNLFADRVVDREVMGQIVPASMFQSLNPIFIITLAPLFAMLWVWLAGRGLEPLTPVKFGLGLVQAGLGFLVLVFGAGLAGEGGKVALIWLVMAYFFHTTGELCLSPVGLSMVTKLSIPRMVGFMMGVWFLSSAAAQYVASLIAQMTHVDTVGGHVGDAGAALASYLNVFQTIGWVGVGIGGVLLLLSPLLRRGMHGVR